MNQEKMMIKQKEILEKKRWVILYLILIMVMLGSWSNFIVYATNGYFIIFAKITLSIFILIILYKFNKIYKSIK